MAGEDRTYQLVVEHTETGELQQLTFEDGNLMRPWFKDHPEWELVDKAMVVRPRHVSHALGPIKRTMVSIRNEVKERFGLRDKDLSMQVYLTGKGNFRERLATEREYKGNRDRTMRPYWYEECRVYLQERWGARVIEGHEADDEISITARQLWAARVPHVVATVDKDLDQVPGPHFDYAKKVWYHVDEEDAMMFFYEQVLCGDATDNIPGIYRMGKASAERKVKEWCSDWYGFSKPEQTLEQWLWSQVVEEYAQAIEKAPDRYKGTDPHAVALENARLVKMQDHRGQLWTPPGQIDEVIDDE